MLSVILAHCDLGLVDMPADEAVAEHFRGIQGAALRSADLTRQLLAFARKQTISPKVLDLNATVEGMLKMLRRLIGEDINLVWLPGAALWSVRMDPSQVDQILANLCVNARDAIEGVGKITIETGNVTIDHSYCSEHPECEAGEFVRLAVRDNGCGMDQKVLGSLFEPFFTTKTKGKGSGLGLATVYGIVKQNNGFIDVDSEPGRGSLFKIYLPRHVSEAERVSWEKTTSPLRGNETILLVEDEAYTLDLTNRLLQGLGYRVLSTSSPSEAVRLSNEHRGEIKLLMTDVIMPEMNGKDLVKSVKAICPEIRSLFMSGYTADVIARHGVLDEGVNFIQKPFSLLDLSVKVREVLEGFWARFDSRNPQRSFQAIGRRKG